MLALLPAPAAAQSSPSPAAQQRSTGGGPRAGSQPASPGSARHLPSTALDVSNLAAIKVQASHLEQTTRPTMNRVDAQVSLMF